MEFVGKGRVGKVYLVNQAAEGLVIKIFSPTLSVKAINGLFYNSPHPLSTASGLNYAYWKRRLAHRLSKYCSDQINICDALQNEQNGFISKYISGRRPNKYERKTLYRPLSAFESFFDRIGMPTWSFGRANPFSGSNFILQNKTVFIVDYEQSVPVPHSRGLMGYDDIYFDALHHFISQTKRKLSARLGLQDTRSLEEAYDRSKFYHDQLDVRPKSLKKMSEKVFQVLLLPFKKICHNQR